MLADSKFSMFLQPTIPRTSNGLTGVYPCAVCRVLRNISAREKTAKKSGGRQWQDIRDNTAENESQEDEKTSQQQNRLKLIWRFNVYKLASKGIFLK